MQYLIFLDAPTGVHQVHALTSIRSIAPFKLSSQVIEVPSELNAKEAKSIITFHSGHTALAKDTFEELAEALADAGIVCIPNSAIGEDGYKFQTELPDATKIQVVDAKTVMAELPANPNSLHKH